MAEAYQLQLNQVLGPSWLDKNEYDIDARSAGVGTREQHALMLRSLSGNLLWRAALGGDFTENPTNLRAGRGITTESDTVTPVRGSVGELEPPASPARKNVCIPHQDRDELV